MKRRRLDGDDGITLMELVVTSMLSVIILLIVGSLLINGLRGQHSVTAITTATNDSQLIATTIQADIRNSTAVKTTAVGSDQFVIARVARGTSTVVDATNTAPITPPVHAHHGTFANAAGTNTGRVSSHQASSTSVPTVNDASDANTGPKVCRPSDALINA